MQTSTFPTTRDSKAELHGNSVYKSHYTLW